MNTSGPDRPIESGAGAQADNHADERLPRVPQTALAEEATPSPEAKQSSQFDGVRSIGPGSGVEQQSVTKEFVRRHPAHFIAFSGGAGLIGTAPGTVGTLVAFPLFWLLTYFLAPVNFLLLTGVMFVIGIWACGVTGKALGNHDHSGMVWDEITAFMLVLFLTPQTLTWQAFAFLLFRLFDIIKPWPIRHYEQEFRNGFGVMFDDILAAFFTLLCLASWKAFVM
ncbi:MAG TPA: phosphatidylglycerophosphatase A [Nitrosospira sp.]|nr:phosphatidylglycerophosphatase A [Nitrosospira sp.]